jgi:hypothetical protein
MRYCLFFCFLINYITAASQNKGLVERHKKSPIDTSTFDQWSYLSNPAISNDGNYLLYTINNKPKDDKTLVVRSINGDWQMEYPGVQGSAFFTSDNKHLIFKRRRDTMSILSLGTFHIEDIALVKKFEVIRQDTNELLIYHLNNSEKKLAIRNLTSNGEVAFKNVFNYYRSNNGKAFFLLIEDDKHDMVGKYIRFPQLSVKDIYIGNSISDFVFDNSGSLMAYTLLNKENDSNRNEKSIWFFKEGMEAPIPLYNNEKLNIDDGLAIKGISKGFSKDGTRLFVTLIEKNNFEKKPDIAQVDIWSYLDWKLKSQQLNEVLPTSYEAFISISEKKIVRFQYEHETIQMQNDSTGIAVIVKMRGDHSESFWNKEAMPNFYVVSTKNGFRKQLILSKIPRFSVDAISPDGKYIIARDLNTGDYYTYNIETETIQGLTYNLPIPKVYKENDEPGQISRGIALAAWSNDGKYIYFNDKFDLWKVAIDGQQKAKNLTNGYGRRHNIIFQLAGNYRNQTINNNDTILLTAFNRNNKNAGFFCLIPQNVGDPHLLSMGPYSYAHHSLVNKIKAKDCLSYIITRSAATQSPNFFLTKDFITFIPLTHFYPEKEYNWLTAELVNFKTLDGLNTQAILYKPEDFDSTKKYPIIIHYYEKKSDDINEFKRPEACANDLNIPWFVSNGYVVLVPDIYYKIGFTGESAYNAVIAAAKYISKFPWVEKGKIGLQGHSFGGYETNYIITRTNIFAAAVSASGVSDLISNYGSLSHGDKSKQGFHETGQYRIGATLWQRPDLFIKNSPIFYADRVTSPLLLMNNKNDGAVAFSQGVEFFTALRRLGKVVWMLQYDGQGHSLSDKISKLDYTIRMTQFYDHFLKGMYPPKWITNSIDAKLKGIDSGLKIDKSIDSNFLKLGGVKK